MATSCNTGYSEIAKALAGEAYDVFKYIGVGKGTGQGATHTKLSSECTETGLTRAAITPTSEKTTETDDTWQGINTFTATTTTTVTEAGAFNNATIDLGDMLMVGDLSPTAPMVKDDTLKVTLSVQLKASA